MTVLTILTYISAIIFFILKSIECLYRFYVTRKDAIEGEEECDCFECRMERQDKERVSEEEDLNPEEMKRINTLLSIGFKITLSEDSENSYFERNGGETLENEVLKHPKKDWEKLIKSLTD